MPFIDAPFAGGKQHIPRKERSKAQGEPHPGGKLARWVERNRRFRSQLECRDEEVAVEVEVVKGKGKKRKVTTEVQMVKTGRLVIKSAIPPIRKSPHQVKMEERSRIDTRKNQPITPTGVKTSRW